ncbi:hypothetical protein AEAC466_04460 [Asticcacaulis sp. AC466]|uniref:hypothetical protein n=1 Tax=Asticcacaulis sp. AC466 TaxID=1282362 RepID=UPI0003C401BC|nr:hypothetical protein [Asticcacaulis sp. AC466]ESQ85422.1 hypothetical protein AEAC466_04460 [Asticcacaulis sp. AC466]
MKPHNSHLDPRLQSDSKGDPFSDPDWHSEPRWPFAYTIIGVTLVCGGFWLLVGNSIFAH